MTTISKTSATMSSHESESQSGGVTAEDSNTSNTSNTSELSSKTPEIPDNISEAVQHFVAATIRHVDWRVLKRFFNAELKKAQKRMEKGTEMTWQQFLKEQTSLLKAEHGKQMSHCERMAIISAKWKERCGHDLSKPKRALTSYNIFVQGHMGEVRRHHPNWSVGDCMREVSRLWKIHKTTANGNGVTGVAAEGSGVAAEGSGGEGASMNYREFISELVPTLKEQHPNKTHAQIMKMANSAWREKRDAGSNGKRKM
jgi:hypothetical protein